MNKSSIIATLNKKIDALILKERVQGKFTTAQKKQYTNLCKYHKTLIFG